MSKFLLLILSLLVTPAYAASNWIQTGGEAPALIAWGVYCQSPQYAYDCKINPEEPTQFELTKSRLETIQVINNAVNNGVYPVVDGPEVSYDIWTQAESGRGDCEDFQLLKRKLLVQSGIPRRALNIVVVIDELGQGHAVLAVTTDKGDYILDNKKNTVLLWHQTGYKFIKREVDGKWVFIS